MSDLVNVKSGLLMRWLFGHQAPSTDGDEVRDLTSSETVLQSGAVVERRSLWAVRGRPQFCEMVAYRVLRDCFDAT